MKKDKLNQYLGKLVHVTFWDGSFSIGILEYVPEFKEKYGWRHPNMFYVGGYCFKADAVTKVVDMNKGES